jgi:hypothetical protein
MAYKSFKEAHFHITHPSWRGDVTSLEQKKKFTLSIQPVAGAEFEVSNV